MSFAQGMADGLNQSMKIYRAVHGSGANDKAEEKPKDQQAETYSVEPPGQVDVRQLDTEVPFVKPPVAEAKEAWFTPASEPEQNESGDLGGIPPASMISAFGGSGSGGGTGASAAASAVPAWPVAVAAGVLAHNEWAKNKGMHTDKDALLGRAAYKDADWYQPRLNSKIGGMGDEVKLASLGSSPIDMFRASTWKDAAKLAVKGGIAGNILKKIF